MSATSKKLIFFGNERLATGVTTKAPLLKGLIDAGYQIAAVVTNQRALAASRQQRPLEIEQLARQNQIPVVNPTNLGEAAAEIAKFQAPAAVLAAYGRIVPQAILDIFPLGIINVHPSLLPQYRGSSPIEQAILDGAAKTGVSLMRLVAKMDAGPVFATAELKLLGGESKQKLFEKLDKLGAELLIEHIPTILAGQLKPKAQSGEASYTPRLTKPDGQITWAEPAKIIERKVRAYAGWPKARARLGQHEVIINQARVAKDRTYGALVIKAEPGWLEILELVAPSGRLMSGADYLRGYEKQ